MKRWVKVRFRLWMNELSVSCRDGFFYVVVLCTRASVEGRL